MAFQLEDVVARRIGPQANRYLDGQIGGVNEGKIHDYVGAISVIKLSVHDRSLQSRRAFFLGTTGAPSFMLP